MRDLSGTLLEAEQQKASYTPYVRVYLPDASSEYSVVEGRLWGRDRVLARKSDGTLCLVYQNPNEVHIIYSTDEGVTWSGDEQVSPADGKAHWLPVVAVDSQDYIHVAWHAVTDHYIKYRKKTSSWGSVENACPYAKAGYPSMAIDSNDNVHIVWHYDSTNDGIYYNQRTTSWGTLEVVFAGVYSMGYPSIAVDYSDNIHVVFPCTGRVVTDWNIYHDVRIDGSWSGPAIVVSLSGHHGDPHIAVDEADNLHIAWKILSGLNNDKIGYRKKTSAWQDEEYVVSPSGGAAAEYPDISLDSYGNIRVTWDILDASSDYEVHSRKRTFEWSSIEEIATTHDSSYNHLLWATWPLVAGKRTNRPKTGYAMAFECDPTPGALTIKYLASPDLTWE